MIDIVCRWILIKPLFITVITNLYVLIEFSLALTIISLLQNSKKMKMLLRVIIITYVVFWFYAKFTFESINEPYYITGSISSALLALCGGFTLFIVIDNEAQPLLKDYRFWVSLAFILYYTITLLPIALKGVLFNHSVENMHLAWSITWIIAIISNILYSIAFLCPQTRA